MRKGSLRAKLQRMEALSSIDDRDALLTGLRSALHDGSNHVVAKAAAIAASHYVTAAVPELLAAYDRLFIDAEAADPLALGKQAIAQALKDLDFREAAPFARGLQYFEPVRGSEDRAAGLRVTCAHALVACDMRGLSRLELLTDHLVDADRAVRREVVRAIAQIGGTESVLLLRLKALVGDSDAEVIGECFAALLDLEPRDSITFVERFLASRDEEVVVEAISALAGSRVAEALGLVRRLWTANISTELRRVILFSCAASPLAEAGEFLLSVVADRRGELGLWALLALGSSRFRSEVKERAWSAAQKTADAGVVAAYVRAFDSS
jgi:hypothetical protein